MNLYAMSDNAIASELGHRLKHLRLRRNMTQEALSENTCLSLNTIKAMEAGKAKLSTLINVLRALDALDQLNQFIPEITISPMQLAKMRGKQRQRASGKHEKSKGENSGR